MKAKGLSNRVVIGAIAGLAGIAILLYIAYLSHREFEETLVSQTQQQLLTVAKTTASRLEEFTGHLSRELKILAKEPAVKEEIKNRTRQTEADDICPIKIFYEARQGKVDALTTLDARGIMLQRYPFIENRPGMDLTDKAGVAHVIREHKPHISEWFYNNLGRPAISISEPVFYRDKFIGMVRWVISLDILSKNFIQPIKAGKEGYALLLDDRGAILSHPDAKQLGKHIITARKSKFPGHDWSALEHIVEKARRGEEGVGAYIYATYGKRLIAYAPVHIGNQLWSIGVSMDYSEITGPLYRHAAGQITIAGLVMLLFAAAGFTFYKIEKKNTAELRRRNEELKQKVIERKRAEEALKESEKKFRAIFDNAIDGILLADVEDKRFYTGNKMICQMLGYTPEEIKNLGVKDIHPKEYLPYVIEQIGKLSRKEMTLVKDIPVQRKDGAIFYADINSSPIRLAEKTYLMGIFRDVTERKRAEEQIRASLREKEALLKEIHHRVKNNLQVISSLLKLQSQYIKDEKNAEIFKDSQNRIRSIALVHEKLYQSEDLANIDFNEYVKHLISALFRSYGVNTDRIVLKTDIEDIMIGIDTAIPCALIINELVSNSLKYAFPEDREGEIEIVFHTSNEDTMELTVRDNGIGIPEDLEVESSASLGLKLVSILTSQIQGELSLDRSSGTRFQIKFREAKYRKRI